MFLTKKDLFIRNFNKVKNFFIMAVTVVATIASFMSMFAIAN